MNITQQRLHNQHITRPTFEKPGDVVRWLGAVQAQDFLGSLWAIGLRMHDVVEADIEQAIADRDIVRTWPMRGTIHFVPPEDVRWMLKLMASRVVAASQQRLARDYEIDMPALATARKALVVALQDGKQLTRSELYGVLEGAGLPTFNGRGLMLMGRLAHDGLICFGARKGKQATFTLLDEWIPSSLGRSLTRDEALGEIAARYFKSHGPATLQDFVWWTGLTVADARAGFETVKSQFVQEVVDGKSYWLSPSTQTAVDQPLSCHLLPPFDEYTVAYKDRSALLDSAHVAAARVAVRGSILNPSIEIDGRIVGTWKRTFKKDFIVIEAQPFDTISDVANDIITSAADRYGRFQGMPAVVG